MGYPSAENRAGCCRDLVHVGVEVITGIVGKVLDIGQRDGPTLGVDSRAQLKVVEIEPERVTPVHVAGRPGHPLAGHRSEHVR